jgi:plastocyanin
VLRVNDRHPLRRPSLCGQTAALVVPAGMFVPRRSSVKSLPFSALALALTLGAPAMAAKAPAWGSGKAVNITVTNDRFAPSRITLKSGRHYTLRFHNASDRGHNFSAKKFFDLARVAPADARKVRHDDVNLDAGQWTTVRIVAPTTPGAAFDFRSTVLRDAGEKMKGKIYVTR